ncbi:MAG TPA: helix-turn-helix domain-containing protein [Pseudoxanthomonas sp.]|nr:helix-turn-helix domain-containing protein [Pseudoxanthomonas sp.]
MPELYDRIRQARAVARMSQAELARHAGVQCSAVAQWERRDGSHPSMQHLTSIALVTGVHLEWLGTGRGPAKPDQDAWTAALLEDDCVKDDQEARCLEIFRKLSPPLRRHVLSLMSLLTKKH